MKKMGSLNIVRPVSLIVTSREKDGVEMDSTQCGGIFPSPEDQGEDIYSQKTTPSVYSTTNEKAPTVEICNIKKGRCQNHGNEARKIIKKNKKWGKKKYSFGWIYLSKVEYHCRLRMEGSIVTDISTLELSIDPDTSAINSSNGRNGSDVG